TLVEGANARAALQREQVVAPLDPAVAAHPLRDVRVGLRERLPLARAAPLGAVGLGGAAPAAHSIPPTPPHIARQAGGGGGSRALRWTRWSSRMPDITDIEDILELPDRRHRVEALLVDCYGRDEELSAFEVYFSDALRPPFAAVWRDPDEPGHEEA